MKKQVQLATRLTQLGRNVKDQYGFVNGPIYRGSTVVFASVEDLEHSRAAFAYGTMGTPTIKKSGRRLDGACRGGGNGDVAVWPGGDIAGADVDAQGRGSPVDAGYRLPPDP